MEQSDLDALVGLGKNYHVDVKDDRDFTEMFKEMRQEKVLSAKETVDDITNQIESRKSLSKEIMRDIDKLKLEIGNTLSNLPSLSGSAAQGNPELIRALSELKRRSSDIGQLKAEEKLNLWRDIADLKKELREEMRELREKEQKDELLTELLSA